MRHAYERWLLSIDVRCDDTVPPAIVMRRLLKHLLRRWGLKCTGLSMDEELMKLRQENAELRQRIDGLTANQPETSPCISTTITDPP